MNRYEVVYSTGPQRRCDACGKPLADCGCKKPSARPPGDGIVRVRLDRKARRGKVVTTITGVPRDAGELRALAGILKRACGSGGAVKDGVIEIQGDHRDRLVAALEARKFRVKRAG